MDSTRPSRIPGALLLAGICLIGVCGLPAAAFFVLLGLHGGVSLNPPLGMGLAALFAYPVAVWLWWRARRPGTTGKDWLLATLGLVLVAGTSVVPVVLLGSAIAEVWSETQPGGRGYLPPSPPR